MGLEQNRGFDPPLLDEMDLDKVNKTIERLSEMINVLLSKQRDIDNRLKDLE